MQLDQIGGLAKEIVGTATQFVQQVLQGLTQLLVGVAVPLAVLSLLLGLILHFSHLNRRMGRDLVVLAVILAVVSQAAHVV